MRRVGTGFVMLALSAWFVHLPIASAVGDPREDETIKHLWIMPAQTGLWLVLEVHSGTTPKFRAGFRIEHKDWHWLADAPGTARALAVVNNQLYAAFADGPIRRYDWIDRIEEDTVRKLPNHYKLELLTTDVLRKRLFVLASRVASGEQASGCTLFEYRRGKWSPLADLPESAGPGGGLNLAVQTRTIDLLAREGVSTFRRWTRRDNRWDGPASIELAKPVDRYWLAGSSTGTKLIMVTARQREDTIELELFFLDAQGEENELGSPVELKLPGKPALDPDRLDVAFTADRVMVAWLSDDRTVKLAPFDLSGQLTGKIRDLPVGPRASQVQDIQLVHLLLFAAIILLFFFTRALRPASTPALPGNVVLADHWRRLASAVIDLVPVVVVCTWIWWSDLEELSRGMSAAEMLENEAAKARFAYIQLYMLCAYAVYCTAAELIWSATPGKMVLSMQARSAKSPHKKPSPLQIVVRNAFKIFELSYPLILIVMFFTRLRQRLGDVAAGTIVVHRPKISRPIPGEPKNER